MRGDHATDHHHDVACALRVQRLDQLRNQRLVSGRLARDADDVHVVLDRAARGFLGRLEQRSDVDVETEDRRARGRDHLGAAVVAVLAELGHEDARPPALFLRELVDFLANARELFVVGVGAKPYTPEMERITAR